MNLTHACRQVSRQAHAQAAAEGNPSLSSQAPGTAAERLLAIVDRNRDLHLVHLAQRASAKLASNVDAAAWHDSAPMLAAVVDGRLVVWQHPGVAFADAALLEATRAARGERCAFAIVLWPGSCLATWAQNSARA